MLSPFLHIEQRSLNYHSNPTEIFSTLCATRDNTLLLDSAEIHSKNSLKSLLIIDSALRISCKGARVSYQALTENGIQLLTVLFEYFQQKNVLIERDGHYLHIDFPVINTNVDEDSRLKELTVFDGLRALTTLFSHANFPIMLGGLFSYDLVASFIPMDGIALQEDGLNSPDYAFYLAENLMIFDHQTQQASLQSFCFCSAYQNQLTERAEQLAHSMQIITPLEKTIAAPTDIKVSIEDEPFKEIIDQLKTHIYQGDVFQIVPSRRFTLACPNPLATYQQLKINNPSPYMFYMQDCDFTLFGASPESALKYNNQDRQLEIYPIAGSRPRGFDSQGNIDPELDARLELDMRLDKKELAEHLMLVDLARNDVARVCQSGTRQVKELMQVDRYSHIMHLVSRVVGKLRSDLDALHAYQACMNMGTLTGAPKIKAMQLIYQYEKQRRHSYGGAVGYLTSDGDLDTCIVIRSAFVQNGYAHVQAGCGEVLDSNPQLEADETRHKAQAVIKAIQQINARGQ